jgi:fibronectin-binding autotransporter adhesin
MYPHLSITVVGRILVRSVLLFLLVPAGPLLAQQDVYWRSDTGSTVWFNEADRPWYYATWDSTETRPDIWPIPTRNFVIFDNNNQTTTTVNGVFFNLDSLTIESAASSARTYNSSDGGGISLTSGLYINSSANQTFNAPIGVDGDTVQFRGNSGNATISLTSDLYLNSNTAEFGGDSSSTVFEISGAVSGAGGNITKVDGNTLRLTNNNTYTGSTTVNAGTLQLGTGGTSGWVGSTSGLTNNGTVIYNRSNDATASFVISGTGALTKNGTGHLTLSGANTYTGTTTINSGSLRLSGGNAIADTAAIVLANTSGAVLRINDSETIGSLSGGGSSGGSVSISSSAVLTVAETGSSTYSGVISGGAFTKSGSGTLSLTAANSYTGATTINAGTLQIGNGGTTGALSTSSAITVNGTLAFNRSNQISQGSNFSSTLGGSGSVAQNGSGILVLSAANTHSGGTILNSGTLQFSNTTAFGTGTVTLNSGTLSSTTGTARSFANAITIGGDVQIGNATQTGAITASGAIDLGAGLRTLTIEGNGTTLSGVISGSGGLVKTGAAGLTLNAANTYSGSTVINQGTLALGSAGLLSSSTEVSMTNGGLNLGSRTQTLHSLAMSGGTLSRGGAVLTLSNASSITGGEVLFSSGSSRISTSALLTLGNTTFTSSHANVGTVNNFQLGGNLIVNELTTANFNVSGAGTPFINLGNAARVFDVGEDANFNINWSIYSTTASSGALTKNGTGTLTLNGTNTYTGATTINAGTLVLNGTNTGSAIAINSGGTLAGTGSGGGTTVNSGGLISPGGSSVGTLATSTLTLEGGGGYTFSIDNVTGSAGTNWDLLNVGGGSGTVTINASSGSPFTIYLTGNPTGWSGAGTYAWDIISSSNLSGFAADKFAVDLGGFSPVDRPGNFFLSNSGTALVLNYAVLGDSIWSGGSGNWDTGFSSAPSNNAAVYFAGAGGTATNNILNASLDTLDSITFNSTAASYTLAANSGSAGDSATPLTLVSGIVNNSSSAQTVNLAMSFNADRLVDTASGNITIGGVISGEGGLTKNGTHTLTLSGVNTFNGSVQINSGTLATTVANALADAVDVTVASGATYSHSGGNDQIRTLNATGSVLINSGTLTVGGNTASSVSGQISGDGLLIKAGTGSLTLSNSGNSYSGGTRLTSGTLLLDHNNALGSGNLNFDSSTSGTLRSTDGTTRTIANNIGVISGSGWNVNFGTADSGDIVFSSTSSASLGSGSAIRTFTVNNAATTFAMAFTNTSNLAKSGTGTMILTGNSTYTGTTTINAGTLQLGAGGGTGSIASPTIVNNAALRVDRTGSLTLSSNMSGTGTLTKNGSGTLVLTGSNTYSGGTTLNAGNLTLQSSNALGTGTLTQSSGSSLLTIDTTGTLTNTMSLYNVLTLQSATLSGAITVNNATFDVDDGDTLTLSGGVGGTGGVTKNGTGNLVLSGSNTYSGATIVNAGVLEAANANALGSTTGVTVNGGSLLVSADDAINSKSLTLNKAIVGDASAAQAALVFDGVYSNTSGQAGALTLSQNSIIDLGTGGVEVHFASIANLNSYILHIFNWEGDTVWSGSPGGGKDQFYVDSSLSSSQLDNIRFYSGTTQSSFISTGFQIVGGSFNQEIIAVPEPETYATAILLLVGFGLYARREFLRRRVIS